LARSLGLQLHKPVFAYKLGEDWVFPDFELEKDGKVFRIEVLGFADDNYLTGKKRQEEIMQRFGGYHGFAAYANTSEGKWNMAINVMIEEILAYFA
jgi:hypothetical protein